MSLSIHKMCRGQGVAYMLVEFTSEEHPDEYSFKAFSETGIELPLESYVLSDYSTDLNGVVLATPLLNTKKVIVYAYSEASECSPTWSKSISRSKIKWSSRLFYKLDWNAAHDLRDIDATTYSDQIHVRPQFASRSSKPGQIIIKGIICTPGSEVDATPRVIDGLGNNAPNISIKLFGSNSVVSNGVQRLETAFSLRLPDDGNAYCLVVDGSDRCRSGFLCFDLPSLDFYCDVLKMPFYRSFFNGRWDTIYRGHLKRTRLVSADDYVVNAGPLFSVVVPLYNTPLSFFSAMVESVVGQVYDNWELVLVNSTPGNTELSEAISKLTDLRIQVVNLETNLGISGNTNAGIDASTGNYIVFFDHDDVLDKMALAKYAKAISENEDIDALYCDEDLLDEDGKYCNPHFKSDFNIDLLRAHNYITHLLAVKASLARELPLRSAFDGAQDYDFLLRLAERTKNFYHVPEVLYHWRMSDTSTAKSSASKGYADEAGLNALKEHIERCGLNASADYSNTPFLYKTRYRVNGNPLVSIVIPNKDCSEILRRCVVSIEEKTTYRNFEIVIVENNSELDSTVDCYKFLEDTYGNVRVVNWLNEFNYSKINNFGFSFCSGEYFLLLNNDIEVIDGSWLDSMLGFCQREDVGAVGAKLLYPDDTVQHAGVAMIHCDDPSEMGGPVHVFYNLDKDDGGYFGRATHSQDLSAVTGACLMTKRSVFESLGGLNEDYRVAYNDIDYCFRVRKQGYLVVYDADAILYHYESFSRGSDLSPEKKYRFASEQGRLRLEWPEYFFDGDGYHSRMIAKDDVLY